VLGADRESGTLRTVPGRISDGSAPTTSELARYRTGQACAICSGPDPVGRRRAVIDHRLSPGTTVWAGVDEVWGSGSAEDCARELLGEGGSADWLERSEALEPVEGACSAEAVELSDRDWEAPVPAVASGAGWSA